MLEILIINTSEKMKLLLLPFIAFMAVMPVKGDNSRIVETLNFGWRFHAGDLEGAQNNSTDDSGWKTIDVPHDFQISQPWVAPSKNEKADNSDGASNVRSRLSSRAFKEMGIGWYRKTITPNDSWKGKRVIVDFEGIMLVGDVYLNGERIGGTDYGYVGFDIDITNKLKWGQPNVIAVKANTMNPENSRWYTGAGLYRNVNIIVTNAKQYFTRNPLYITTPEVSANKATVKVCAEMACFLKNKTIKTNLKIVDPNGNVVVDKVCELPFNRKMKINEHLIDSIEIAHPMLWDCENPNLYKVVVSMLNTDGDVVDEVSENFGIRKIEYSPEFGFKLNGKKIIFKGIANHHTLGALGLAAYPSAIEKRIKLLTYIIH